MYVGTITAFVPATSCGIPTGERGIPIVWMEEERGSLTFLCPSSSFSSFCLSIQARVVSRTWHNSATILGFPHAPLLLFLLLLCLLPPQKVISAPQQATTYGGFPLKGKGRKREKEFTWGCLPSLVPPPLSFQTLYFRFTFTTSPFLLRRQEGERKGGTEKKKTALPNLPREEIPIYFPTCDPFGKYQ